LPELGDITSRTYSYDEGSVLSANQILERLSSIRGVVDVVIIEEERIAYLKVDNGAFDDGELALIGN
jgi:hypothetical protein